MVVYLYGIDLNNRYKLYHEDIIFVEKYGYALIGNPDHSDGTSTDHEYFLSHDDLFDRMFACTRVLILH